MTAGAYVQIAGSQRAFIPALLPPDLDLDLDVINALSAADRAIGALASLGSTLPHAHLLIQPFLGKEAVASSRIEGTQADFGQLAFFNEVEHSTGDDDVRETNNYLKALNYGLSALQYRPISLGLLKEMHGILLERVRGEQTNRGAFRTIQNFIGNRSDAIEQARNSWKTSKPISRIRQICHHWCVWRWLITSSKRSIRSWMGPGGLAAC